MGDCEYQVPAAVEDLALLPIKTVKGALVRIGELAMVLDNIGLPISFNLAFTDSVTQGASGGRATQRRPLDARHVRPGAVRGQARGDGPAGAGQRDRDPRSWQQVAVVDAAGRVRVQKVVTSTDDGQNVEVDSGLRIGEPMVVGTSDEVTEGARVKAVPNAR